MKPVYLFSVLLAVCAALVLNSCEKEITVDIPVAEPQIVVEGSIEQGRPPIVLLSWSQGYFEPTDLSTLENFYIKGATVTVSDGISTTELTEICTSDIPDSLLQIASDLLGFSPEALAQFNICGYIGLDPAIFGVEGRTYSLSVQYEGHELSAQTKIDHIVNMDSLWFAVISSDPEDSLGFVFGNLTDPDTAGNAYRWYSKRISHYPAWVAEYDPDLVGQQEDQNYIAPLGSVFDDEFFNGLSFEFGYYRGPAVNSEKFDDLNAERGYFKRGDTIAVKGCVIDRGVYDFISSLEDQSGSQGSPFTTPFNLKTNIVGGLGVWAGYGAVYDTIVCP